MIWLLSRLFIAESYRIVFVYSGRPHRPEYTKNIFFWLTII
jgi:hypothetical protein